MNLQVILAMLNHRSELSDGTCVNVQGCPTESIT
jgi:hypothetical protein